MNEPWVIYLEFSKKLDSTKIRDLAKRQFWMQPLKDELQVTFTLVVPKSKRLLSLAGYQLRVLRMLDGLVWVSHKQIKELYAARISVNANFPTPRMMIKFWKSDK